MKKEIKQFLEGIGYLPKEEQAKRARCYIETFLPEEMRTQEEIERIIKECA